MYPHGVDPLQFTGPVLSLVLWDVWSEALDRKNTNIRVTGKYKQESAREGGGSKGTWDGGAGGWRDKQLDWGRWKLNNRGKRRKLNRMWGKAKEEMNDHRHCSSSSLSSLPSCTILSDPIHIAWCASILYSWVFNSWWGGCLLGAYK